MERTRAGEEYAGLRAGEATGPLQSAPTFERTVADTCVFQVRQTVTVSGGETNDPGTLGEAALR